MISPNSMRPRSPPESLSTVFSHLVAAEQQAAERRADRLVVVARLAARAHPVEHGDGLLERGRVVLRHVRDLGVLGPLDGAVVDGSSPMIERSSVVLPMPFVPTTATRSPASIVQVDVAEHLAVAVALAELVDARRRADRASCPARSGCTGSWRLDGLTSASSIFSICRLREVAWRDFEAFAEKRLTNACKSAICAFFFALSENSCSRACVAAVMYSS